MRTRSRVLVAVVIALAMHFVARIAVEAMQLRARPLVATHDEVAIELDVEIARHRHVMHTPAPPSAPAPAPRQQRSVRRSAPPPTTEARGDDVIAREAEPPVAEPGEDLAPRLPQTPPRSFLERVIAGTTGLAPPNLDELMRAPPSETEGDAAQRKVQELARAAGARGRPPPVDAGTAIDSLEKQDDGSYRYETGGFVATIHVDGHVTFVNKDNKGGAFSSGLPGRDPDNIMQPYGPDISLPTRVDGTRPAGTIDPAATLASGSFDPTAAMLRAQGQDPYEHEKLCFLDETVELRAELRIAHEKAQMAGLRRSLERAWFDDEHTPAERRAALFAIWDECREEEVGLMARELVESFVRQHLPKGSADAFTDDELAALNATRTSVMEFRPYG